MSSGATAAPHKASCLNQTFLAAEPRFSHRPKHLSSFMIVWANVHWMDGSENFHGFCGSKVCLEDVPWGPWISWWSPRVQAPAAPLVCMLQWCGAPRNLWPQRALRKPQAGNHPHQGLETHPGWALTARTGFSPEEWQRNSDLVKELLLFSLSFFVYLLVQSDFSNPSADLTSQVLHQLWVQCWWVCPIRSLTQGLKALAAMGLMGWLTCGSSTPWRLRIGSQPARLPGLLYSSLSRCACSCWQTQSGTDPSMALIPMIGHPIPESWPHPEPYSGCSMTLLGLSHCLDHLLITLVLYVDLCPPLGLTCWNLNPQTHKWDLV